MSSPFEVLGIDEDADEETIERAYRDRVKDVHPDQGGSLEAFIAVKTAYERLTNGSVEASGDVVHEQPGAGSRPTDVWSTGRTAETENGSKAGTRNGARYQGNGQGRARKGSPYWNAQNGETTEVTYLNYDVLSDFGWSIDDDDLLEKAAAADLDVADFGTFHVQPGDSLLEGAEHYEYAWPFACRGGACANCAIYLRDGELSMPVSHILPEDLMEEGFRLSCNGYPDSAEMTVVFNVKHMPKLEELLLPPRPYEQAYDD